MPVTKKIALAIKRGGDLPRNPHLNRLVPEKPQVAREEPPPIGQLPESPKKGSEPMIPVEGLLVTVNSHSIKTKGRGKYRSYMGTANIDKKLIWWSAPFDKEEVPRGSGVRITGQMGTPFGKKGDIFPIRKISKISTERDEIAEKVKEKAVEAKVSPPTTDNLLQKISALLSEHGQSKVLRALAEATE